jgi:hypothetical protein
MKQSRCGLSVTNGSCDVLQHQVGIVCDEWDVKVLGEETTVVFEPLTARSQCASLGIGDEV